MSNLFTRLLAHVIATKTLGRPSRILLGLGMTGILSTSAFSSHAKPLSSPQVIRIYQVDSRYNYRIDLLNLAISKTEGKYGTAVIQKQQAQITNARGLSLLKSGNIDIASFASTPELESAFYSIKIPLLQGLLGYRVFLVKKSKQAEFQGINRIGALKSKVAGSGAHWADTTILRTNGLSVISSPRYENLFELLNKQRIDYFPRGIHEARKELNQHKRRYPQLQIESSKALFYPFPVYFYVNKNNRPLQQRITEGLQKALADGSMQALFKQHHASSIQQIHQNKRQVFCLNNPLLQAQPKLQTQWWLGRQSASTLCTRKALLGG